MTVSKPDVPVSIAVPVVSIGSVNVVSGGSDPVVGPVSGGSGTTGIVPVLSVCGAVGAPVDEAVSSLLTTA